MNFLAHLYLSGNDPEVLVGNMMGDFVKGRIGDRFPTGIRKGLELHRRIDSFAHGNALFILSKRRIDPSFGLYRGVLVDLFYDHLLALDWDDYSDLPFHAFLEGAYGTVREYEDILPMELARVLPALFTELIPSYREIAGVERALARMSARIGRVNPLAEGGEELKRHYDLFRSDSRRFFSDATDFVRSFLDVGSSRCSDGPSQG